MKKTYTAPTLIKIGNAIELTQAKCIGGWAECLDCDLFYHTKCGH